MTGKSPEVLTNKSISHVKDLGVNLKYPEVIEIGRGSTIESGVTLRYDVALPQDQAQAIKIGKYTYIEKDCCIVPPLHSRKGDIEYHECIQIGAFCIIGTGSEVRSLSIGNRVVIGARCSLGERSVIYNCCYIHDNTIIPPKKVIPPFSEVSGIPGVDFIIKSLNPSFKRRIEDIAREREVCH